MPESRKLRVFLCHASQDKPVVRELYQQLRSESWIEPWLDEEKLLPGQDWDMEIEKAVEAADVVVVCLSNTSISKEGYIQRELKFALDIALEKPDGAIFIIPLRLDDCELPRRLRTWQYVDYFPADRRSWALQRLMKSLKIRYEDLGSRKGGQEYVREEVVSVPVEPIREEVTPAPVEEAAKRVVTTVPEEEARNPIVELLLAKGIKGVDVGGTFPLLAYFLLASLELLGPSDDAVRILLGGSAVVAAVFFLIRKTIPETVVFKVFGIMFLLLYGVVNYSDYTGVEIPFISIIAGIAAILCGGVLLVTLQRPKKPIYYSAISFAVFLFIVVAKQYYNYIEDYDVLTEMPILVASVVTSLLLWRDL